MSHSAPSPHPARRFAPLGLFVTLPALIPIALLGLAACASNPCSLYTCPDVAIRRDPSSGCPRNEYAVAVNPDSRAHSFRVKRVVRYERDTFSVSASPTSASDFTSGAPGASAPPNPFTVTYDGPYTVAAGSEFKLGCTLELSPERVNESETDSFRI
jgi:hypothetical protein